MADAAPPRIPWQRATITRAERRTPRVRSLVLRPSLWRPFRAGQHLDVRLTAPDGYQAQRSYSIASSPEQTGAFELLVERLEDGEVSPYLHDVADAGDAVEIRGPFGGHFVWEATDGGPLLLVGGGTGVAPLLSILRHRAAVAPEVAAVLVQAARTWDDAIERDELLSRDAAEPGFDLILSLSRDAPRRAQDVGRRIDADVLQAALAKLGAAGPRVVFLCGSNMFVEVVSNLLLDLGVVAGAIRTERFGG